MEIPTLIISINSLLSSLSTIIIICLVIYGIKHIGRAIKKTGEQIPSWIESYFTKREQLLIQQRAFAMGKIQKLT